MRACVHAGNAVDGAPAGVATANASRAPGSLLALQVRAANQVEKRGARRLANLKIHRILLLKLGVGGLWLLIAP